MGILADTSSGIPYNLQTLGRRLKRQRQKTISESAISEAVDDLIRQEGSIHYTAYLYMMQTTEIKVIRTMAVCGVNAPKDIAVEAGMHLNGVTALLRTLLDKGVVNRESRGRYVFTDMFRTWISRTCG